MFATTGRGFWFGSDFLGRDVLSRLLVGARFTVGLSAVAVALAAATGTGLALTAAVGPRWLDAFLSRAMDTLISIPSKIFALVVVAAFGSSLVLLTLIISVTYVPGNFRIARSLADRLTRLDYVEVARALAAEPDVILCDEVTSALDTVVRGAILDLLAELRRDLGVAYLFISHDIATVKALCDEIVVLSKGTRVESGLRDSYTAPPFHPYTDLLIASVPELRPGWLADETAQVMAPLAHIAEQPDLGRFLPRCPVAIPGRCDVAAPPLRTMAAGNVVLCHRSEAELAS